MVNFNFLVTENHENEGDLNEENSPIYAIQNGEENKSDLDAWSSFVEETLSNADCSEHHFDWDALDYKLNVIETKRRNQNIFNFGVDQDTCLPMQPKIIRGESFAERRQRHDLLDVPSSFSYYPRNKNNSYGESKLWRINSTVQKPKNLLEFLYVRTISEQPRAETKSLKKANLPFERMSSCPRTNNTDILMSEWKFEKLSIFGSSKKQVRFADTAGEGPLYEVFKDKKLRKKKRLPTKGTFINEFHSGRNTVPQKKHDKNKKGEAKAPQVSNSWSCIIF